MGAFNFDLQAFPTFSLAGESNSPYRGFGCRVNAFYASSIPNWWTPLLSATWPNASAFDEYPADSENYNDIYATY